jgi:hypothetical protein
MAQIDTITVLIRGEDQASGPIQKVTRSLGHFDDAATEAGKSATGLTGLLGKIGLAGLGFGAVVTGAKALGGALLGPIGAASDLAESISKADVVFGQSAPAIQAWAKTAAQAFGQSRAEALEAAGSFGNLFVSMGLGQAPAADLSKRIVELGSDLASFNNIKPEEALEKLRAGLVGEAEPLRALGVNINAAAVEDEALRLGLAKTKDEITDAAKIQARYSLILKQTKTAQGDFARTSTGLANSQRIIAASFADLQTQIGERLLPVIAPLVSSFATALPRAMDAVAPALDTAGEALSGLGSTLGGLLGTVQPVLDAITDEFEVWRYAFEEGGIGGILEQAADDVSSGRLLAALVDLRGQIVAQLATWGAAFVAWVTPLLPQLSRMVLDLASVVLDQIRAAVPLLAAQFAGWVRAFVDWAKKAVPPLLDALGQVGEQVISWIVDWAPVLIDTLLGEWLPAALSWVVETAKEIGPELGKLFVAVTDWIGEHAPELLERFIGEWVPAAIVWVAKAAIALIPELAKMLVAIGYWLFTDGVPAIIRLFLRLGEAVVTGLVRGVGTLGSELGNALETELRKIRIDVGPFHLSAAGFTIDPPTLPPIRTPFEGPPAAVKPGLGVAGVGAYQHGGSFYVGGRGGADSQYVAFRATPGERVDVRTPAQQRAGGPVVLTVNQSFTVADRADAQYLADVLPDALARALEKARTQQGMPVASGLVRWT